jgi:hypothetical protein
MTLLRLSPKPRSTLVCSRSPVVTFLLHPSIYTFLFSQSQPLENGLRMDLY